MERPIRLILVEDNPEYREVIELALCSGSGIELIGQFGTAESAWRSLEERRLPESPDIILLDLNLPGMDGLQAIPYFREVAPGARIIVLTRSDREADVLGAIRRGAAGYLLKSSTVEQITEGIRTVMEGGASLDAGIARFILQALQAKLPEHEPQRPLSEREMEILALLAEGLFRKEIADRLGIGLTTVVTHLTHIYEKLDATNAPAAVDKAHRLGLFPRSGGTST